MKSLSLRAPSPRAVGAISLVFLIACSDSDSDSDKNPKPTAVTAEAVPGADNDFITVTFNREVNEAEIEQVANWSVESPLGTTFVMTGSTIDYDPTTMTVTATLGAGTVGTLENGNNLQYGEQLRISWTGVKGVNGDNLKASPTVDVTGDDDPPFVVSAAADGVGTIVTLHFSEATKEVLFSELYSGLPGDPGPRLRLIDADSGPAVAATGSATIQLLPLDGDTIVIDDDTQTVVFEFDSDASVVNAALLRQVLIGVDTVDTAANLATAINDAGFTFDVTASASGSVVSLTHDVPGSAGNNTIITTSGAVAVTGLSGGADSSSTYVSPVASNFVWAADGLSATVDFDPVVPDTATDSIEVYGLEDLAGNSAFAQPSLALVAEDLTAPGLDTGNSTITSVPGEANDQIVVEFNTPMSPAYVTEPSNYAAAPLDLSNAQFDFDGVDTVTITLPDGENVQTGTNYTLTLVANATTLLRSAQGVPLAGDDTEVIAAAGDSLAILAAQVQAYVGDVNHPFTAVVVYPEAVEPVGATDVSNYSINAANPFDAELISPLAVRLTFTVAPVAADSLTIQPAAATDLAGNVPVAPLVVVLTDVDSTAPTATLAATTVENLGGDTIVITFDEPMDPDAATNRSNYSLRQNGNQIDLSDVVTTYDSSANAVTFWLPEGSELTTGATVSANTGNLRDLSGNLLAANPADATVTGDSTPPDFEAAFINWQVDLTGMTIDVRFTEDVDEGFAAASGNWFTNQFTNVIDADLIASDIVRIRTAGQIADDERLELDGLRDLAGNTSGMISIDPAE